MPRLPKYEKTNEPDNVSTIELMRLIIDEQKAQQDQHRIQQEQQHILTSLVEKLCNQRNDTTISHEALFDRLRKRMEKFSYNAGSEEGSFEIWYNRYQNIFEQECTTWDEQQKTRLLVSMLDGHNHILPRKPADLSFAETVETLKLQFGDRKKALVCRRLEAFQLNMDPQEDSQEYVNRVKAKSTKARFIDIKPNHLECMAYIFGLRDPALADYRAKLLRLLDQNDAMTVDDLAKHFTYWKTTKDDCRTFETSQNIYPVHHSGKKKNPPHKPPHQMYNNNRQTNIPPAPCPICGGNHWKSDCTQKKRRKGRC